MFFTIKRFLYILETIDLVPCNLLWISYTPFLVSRWLYLCAHYIIKHYVKFTAKQMFSLWMCNVKRLPVAQTSDEQNGKLHRDFRDSHFRHCGLTSQGERFDFVPSRAYMDFGIYEWKLRYHFLLLGVPWPELRHVYVSSWQRGFLMEIFGRIVAEWLRPFSHLLLLCIKSLDSRISVFACLDVMWNDGWIRAQVFDGVLISWCVLQTGGIGQKEICRLWRKPLMPWSEMLESSISV